MLSGRENMLEQFLQIRSESVHLYGLNYTGFDPRDVKRENSDHDKHLFGERCLGEQNEQKETYQV